MKTTDGRVVGEHMGLAFYTLGQRKGIGVGGSREGNGEPWFVAKKTWQPIRFGLPRGMIILGF